MRCDSTAVETHITIQTHRDNTAVLPQIAIHYVRCNTKHSSCTTHCNTLRCYTEAVTHIVTHRVVTQNTAAVTHIALQHTTQQRDTKHSSCTTCRNTSRHVTKHSSCNTHCNTSCTKQATFGLVMLCQATFLGIYYNTQKCYVSGGKNEFLWFDRCIDVLT